MEEMTDRTGTSLTELLTSHLEGTQLDEVYIDQDEDGNFVGLVFSDGETEYHLTFDDNGSIMLARGSLQGEMLQEVVEFSLDEVLPPFPGDVLAFN